MARIIRLAAFSFIAVAALTAAAARPPVAQPAPTDRPDARYCLRVAPATGSLVETVQCWTRVEWIDQGVDIDKEWAREGVAVLQ